MLFCKIRCVFLCNTFKALEFPWQRIWSWVTFEITVCRSFLTSFLNLSTRACVALVTPATLCFLAIVICSWIASLASDSEKLSCVFLNQAVYFGNSPRDLCFLSLYHHFWMIIAAKFRYSIRAMILRWLFLISISSYCISIASNIWFITIERNTIPLNAQIIVTILPSQVIQMTSPRPTEVKTITMW